MLWSQFYIAQITAFFIVLETTIKNIMVPRQTQGNTPPIAIAKERSLEFFVEVKMTDSCYQVYAAYMYSYAGTDGRYLSILQRKDSNYCTRHKIRIGEIHCVSYVIKRVRHVSHSQYLFDYFKALPTEQISKNGLGGVCINNRKPVKNQ